MKGYLTTFTDLFAKDAHSDLILDSVEIPLIQRDYAQGRPGSVVEQIRTSFVRVLLDAVAGGEPVGLDFVYGKVRNGTLLPVDGQQRLTTLFLLHWYVASAADRLERGAPWTRFSYSTRPSARLFCQRLATHALPQGVETPSRWITDQEWYLHVWKHDPTIQSMLVVIDAIHCQAQDIHPHLDFVDAWDRLTQADSPTISFHLLPLDDMGSDEDLYIKMNSRGKPLTPFENFKARFERDIANATRAREFARKIDGAWSDLLWPFHGGDDIVDDEFVRYLGFITEICELRDDRLELGGDLGSRARATFGPNNPRAAEHLDFLFDAFDHWTDEDTIRSTFDGLFDQLAPSHADYDASTVTLFGTSGTNLFEQCCHQFGDMRGNSRAFGLQQSLLLYAVLLHLIHRTEDFPKRVRLLRNLIAASEDEIRRDKMPALIADVDEIVFTGDLDKIAGFSSNQVEDEILKQDMLKKHPELAAVLFRLEDNSILRGSLGAFEFNGETFQQRAAAFGRAFSDPTHWDLLTGGLLATGDYHRHRNKLPSWQFGTGSTKNEAVWRYLLTDAPRSDLDATRTVLANFLDRFAAWQGDLPSFVEDLTSTWLVEHERTKKLDWRYYMVKYPSMRSGATGIYWGIGGALGYSMCMLRTKQLNGYYRDPFLLELRNSGGLSDSLEDPWFTGYETAPRWLLLERSGVGVRSVPEGFAIQGPEDGRHRGAFDRICAEREDVTGSGSERFLAIPQSITGEVRTDAVDRVAVGTALLKDLIEAHL